MSLTINPIAIPEFKPEPFEAISNESAGAVNSGPGASSFSSFLQKSVSDVNDMLAESDKKQVDVATGKSENLHDAMITFEKAESSLKLLMQVRNKAIEAYHEVMRMQM